MLPASPTKATGRISITSDHSRKVDLMQSLINESFRRLLIDRSVEMPTVASNPKPLNEKNDES